MTVHVVPTNGDRVFSVNEKSVWKNMAGDWIARPELSDTEKTYFGEYLKMLKITGKSIEVTYRILT